MTMLSLRAREWIAWSVNTLLDLSPPVREWHVQAIVEPALDTELPPLLSPWPTHLHPLIVRAVVRESQAGTWINTVSTDPSPPPLIRR